MKCFVIASLILLITSCRTLTIVTYRASKNSEYIREDGFMLYCDAKSDSNNQTVLTFETFTPESWGDDFYYEALNGLPSDKHFRITQVTIIDAVSGDSLQLIGVDSRRTYYFKSHKRLQDVTKIEVKVSLLDVDNNATEIRKYLLFRNRKTVLMRK